MSEEQFNPAENVTEPPDLNNNKSIDTLNATKQNDDALITINMKEAPKNDKLDKDVKGKLDGNSHHLTGSKSSATKSLPFPTPHPYPPHPGQSQNSQNRANANSREVMDSKSSPQNLPTSAPSPQGSKSPSGSRNDPPGRARQAVFSGDLKRSNTPPTSHLLTVEILGRQVGPMRDKSPYACRIVELPPTTKSANKVIVHQRELNLLSQEVREREHKEEAKPDERRIGKLLNPHPLQHQRHTPISPQDNALPTPTPLMTMSPPIPLKSWPNFVNLIKVAQTQTRDEGRLEEQDMLEHKSQLGLQSSTQTEVQDALPVPQGISVSIQELLSNYNKSDIDSGAMTKSDDENDDALTDEDSSKMTKSGDDSETDTDSAQITKSDDAQTDIDSARMATLEELAKKVEVGIFSASEACNVLINTVFKQSMGNPAALEAVLDSNEFVDFLHSPNEMQALENITVVLDSTNNWIKKYLDIVRSSGASFPSDTNFSTKSSDVVSVCSSKSVKISAQQKKSEVSVWSFVPPSHPNKFQLSLHYNPETGEIMQTITCQDHIFRTRYTTSPLETHRIRGIISANREQEGLPAFVKPESLLDTIVRCSSFASTRLTEAKTLISKCNKKLYTIVNSMTKSKYVISTADITDLDDLMIKLQKINVLSGIINQMSTEMLNACTNIQSGLWNSMYVQDVLRFPRIPGFPNPKLNKECQMPSGTKIPIQQAMNQLAEGLKSIDHVIRIGQFSLEAIRCGGGVNLKKKDKKLIQNYLQGVQSLGSEKDIDYGSLLMTLLCSTEMINHFEDIIPSTDKFIRAAILTHLGKINWGTAELLGIVRRMEADSKFLTKRTTGKLREIRNRLKPL